MENEESSKKIILVTGANGQLGCEFQQLQNNFPDYKFLFVAKDQLSITDNNVVTDFFKNPGIRDLTVLISALATASCFSASCCCSTETPAIAV